MKTSKPGSRTPNTDVVPGSGVVPQIKDRQRIRDLAEVYTHERDVNAMLDLVLDMFPDDSLVGVKFKFLEPGCGSGNFLEEILRRKLRPIRLAALGDVHEFEYWLLRALASIYAVDICAQNVAESRHRLLNVLDAHYRADANIRDPSLGFTSASRTIVETNILRADMLADATALELIDYQPVGRGCFKRTWSLLDESSTAPAQTDLFTHDQPAKLDEVPVHYTRLAESADPSSALLNEPRGVRCRG